MDEETPEARKARRRELGRKMRELICPNCDTPMKDWPYKEIEAHANVHLTENWNKNFENCSHAPGYHPRGHCLQWTPKEPFWRTPGLSSFNSGE